MPAEWRTPGLSVENDYKAVEEEVESARFFKMPAQNSVLGSRIETEPTNKKDVMAMDESEPEPRSDQNKMENTITVECQNFNGRLFNGTVNFSEAKVKIFQDGLGLDVGLPEAVKISFKRFLFL